MTVSIAPSGAEIATRILLIEDDPRDVELSMSKLEGARFIVTLTQVANRQSLVRALDEAAYDVILCDFQLPGFSGLEALEIVKERGLEVPFIFLSGVLGEENAVEMLRRGATDYIVKQRLDLLPIAVRRALKEAEERRGRAQAERSLREREAYFSKLVDSLNDYAVIALSREGSIQSWNAGSQTIFGYTAAEVMGRDASILFPADDASLTLTGQLKRVATQGSISLDRWLMRKDGTSFYASIVLSAIRTEEAAPIGFSYIVRDTTDSRIAADLLQTAKEQAESANAAKDRFLAVLSHELRNPLNPIAAAAKYLELQENLAPNARHSIEIIQRNIRLETRLIDDLLDISRIVNDKLSVDFARVDVQPLIQQVIDGFAAEAIERGIELRVSGMMDTLLSVYGDTERLQQIIWNLVKNALKFTARDGHIDVAIDLHDNKVAIEVRDDGAGIAVDDLQRIFNAFEQGQQSSETQRGGLGLGLAIANTITEKHGGKLTVSSDGPGHGASFVLTLERYHPPQESAADAAISTSSNKLYALRILLAEDDMDSLHVQKNLLRTVGYDVMTASSVAAAKKILQQHRFDVLLSDIGLPDGSGLDVLEAFQAHGGEYAIALTGYGMDGDRRRLHLAGFAEHLVKPLAPDHLLELLRAVALRKLQAAT